MFAKHRLWLIFWLTVTALSAYGLYGLLGRAGVIFVCLTGLGIAASGLLPRARMLAFILVIGMSLGVALSSVVNKSSQPEPAVAEVAQAKTLPATPATPTATATPLPPPTATAIPPTATPVPPCRPAASLSLGDVGAQVCVYGEAASVTTDGIAQYARFGDAAFQVVTYDLNLLIPHAPGNCLQVEGFVNKIGSRPSIIILSLPPPPSVCGRR